MNKGTFMSKYKNYSIVLEAGTKNVYDNGKVDRKPTKRVQFKDGMFNPYNSKLDIKPKEIIKRLQSQPAYGSDFWLIDTASILTADNLVDSSYRELTDKEDGLLYDVEEPGMLRKAIKKEKNKDNSRKTVLKALKKRLKEILDEFSKELEDEEE